jgi:hypothetical protein
MHIQNTGKMQTLERNINESEERNYALVRNVRMNHNHIKPLWLHNSSFLTPTVVMLRLKFIRLISRVRGEIMKIEKCPKNEDKQDIYETGPNGFDVLVHCGNHKVKKVKRY